MILFLYTLRPFSLSPLDLLKENFIIFLDEMFLFIFNSISCRHYIHWPLGQGLYWLGDYWYFTLNLLNFLNGISTIHFLNISLSLFIQIYLKMIMDSNKNGRWIISFKKFIRLRVNAKSNFSNKINLVSSCVLHSSYNQHLSTTRIQQWFPLKVKLQINMYKKVSGKQFQSKQR